MTRAMVSGRGLAAVFVSVLVLGAMAWAPLPAQAKEKDEISAKLRKPLKAAQDAMQKNEWDQVLEKSNEADKIKGKTPYDQYIINEFKVQALLHLKKAAEAAPIYEQNFKSGLVPEDQINLRLKSLVQIYGSLRNWPKVTEYGSRWLKTGNKDPEMQFAIGQAYYAQRDYKTAAKIIEGAIKAVQRAGKTPQENWLRMVQSSYALQNDAEASRRSLEQLVQYYPKTEYWDQLLRPQLNGRYSDRVMVNVYRLADEVGVLKTPDRYLELTEMLLDAGLPGEAKTVMEAGYEAKVFDTTDKGKLDRYTRHLKDAEAAAAKDRQSLPSIIKEAEKARTGQGDVALGMAYSSFGQYDKAVTALTQGLDKGGVKDPDQARMMLGIANLKLGKKADAVKAFEKVGGDPEMASVARLWALAAKSGAG